MAVPRRVHSRSRQVPERPPVQRRRPAKPPAAPLVRAAPQVRSQQRTPRHQALRLKRQSPRQARVLHQQRRPPSPPRRLLRRLRQPPLLCRLRHSRQLWRLHPVLRSRLQPPRRPQPQRQPPHLPRAVRRRNNQAPNQRRRQPARHRNKRVLPGFSRRPRTWGFLMNSSRREGLQLAGVSRRWS